jgi:DNA polymerase III delta subunit
MLYVFLGTDVKKSEEKAARAIDSLLAKAPDASVVSLNEENFSKETLEELLATQGLFKSKIIVRITNIFSTAHAPVLSDALGGLGHSEHVFFLIEGAVSEKDVARLKKEAQSVVVSDVSTAVQSTHNPFALTDALYSRDLKRLFVLLESAQRESSPLEEVAGLLFWAAKTMTIARSAPSPAVCGMKPFVYSKAKTGAAHWGDSLPDLLALLAEVPHESRSTGESGYDVLMRRLLSCA